MDVCRIAEWCSTGTIPDSDELFGTLVDERGLFSTSEGTVWDFKETWPFSLSDDYFGCIARLVCAFGNTFGGIIIFGVHDTKRTGGHNKVSINYDKFILAVKQLLNSTPSMAIRSFESTKYGNIDVLLVQRRATGTRPLRFLKKVGAYKEGVIWVRSDHEVLPAEAAHYPVLFCGLKYDDGVERKNLDGSIPPSPATLKQRFVGRTEVLDNLFAWLEASDEPRSYLHGKGGSGKTTIAYEFAKLIKNYGQELRVYGNDPIDAVIFVSAKEKTLSVVNAQVVDIIAPDFQNEIDLLRLILFYGGWTYDRDYLDSASLPKLRGDIKEFFDLFTIVLVVDDIDTLTTKGIDPGSDFLYRTLCRASKSSKVLYTLRNAPSQSLVNAIEVPGLLGDDYTKFVHECVDHFGVPAPSDLFRTTKLIEISERRPLIIEVIIALRRSCGDYEQAVTLFHQQSGDTVRDYVFLREWEALGSNAPRLLLSALSEFGGPTSFGDLQSVLQFEASLVKDCIGAVREMFLQIDEAGSNALYSIALLTKNFVVSRGSQLVGYRELHERVKAYRRHVAVSNPRVANIATQVERLLPARFTTHSPERVRDAIRIVSDRTLPVFVTEDPLFNVVRGYVLSCAPDPNLAEVRRMFDYALGMKVEPEYKYLREWFNAEKASGLNDGRCIFIADFILNGKRYSEQDKMEMIGRKATSLFARAQERVLTDSHESISDFSESLKCHLRAYKLYYNNMDYRADTSVRYARNTAFTLFGMLAKSAVAWEVFDIIESIGKLGDGYLDPLELPVSEAIQQIGRNQMKADSIGRIRQRVKAAKEAISPERLWVGLDTRDNIITRLQELDADLHSRQKVGSRK